MQKIGAVHFNPKIQPHLQHNDRTNSNADNIRKDLSHLNECDKSASQALKQIDTLYKEAMQKLDEAKKKGKRTPKERSFHEAIFEINESTTMQQCQELTQRIAELTGFTPLQISIHKDEGHTNEQGEWIPHYHAHAVFFTLDKSTGKQLARQEASLNPRNLSKIQDIASKVLEMQRGERHFKDELYQDFLDKKATKPQNAHIKLKYIPQAPQLIQNQDDFKRFKEQTRAFEIEIDKKRTELAQKSLEIEKQYQTITKQLENDFKGKYEAFMNNLRNIQETHKQKFTDLALHYENKKSWWKNILTLGHYNAKIDKDHYEARKVLKVEIERATTDAEIQFQRVSAELERVRNAYDNEKLDKEKAIERLKTLHNRLEQEAPEIYSKMYPSKETKHIREKTNQLGRSR